MELKKLKARGMYEEYHETLNGRIVYKQMLPDDWTMRGREPFYIQWVPSRTGSFEWVIAQGKDSSTLPKWEGEIMAKCKHILTGNTLYLISTIK